MLTPFPGARDAAASRRLYAPQRAGPDRRRRRPAGGRGRRRRSGARGVAGRGPLVDAAAAAPPLLRAGAGRRPRRVVFRSAEERPLVPAAGLMACRPSLRRAARPLGLLLPRRRLDPDELAAAAAALGYPALALTDHDGVWGSMEFAHACKGFGIRPITGAELTVRPRRGASLCHLTLLVETATGYRNLCRLLTAAHAHTRDSTAAQPASRGRRWRRWSSTPRAWSASPAAPATERWPGPWSGATRAEAERLGRRLLGRLRARPLPGRAAAALLAPRPGPQPLAGLARRAARRRPASPPATSTAHDRRRAHLQDALVAVGLGATLEESEPRRRGNSSSVLASPAAMAARFAEHPEAVAETAAPRRAAALRPDRASSATATPAPRTPAPTAELAAICRDAARRALRGSARTARGARAAGGGAGDDPHPRPLRLLPPPPRPARAGARGRGRGARPGVGALRPARRAAAAAPASARSSAT